MSVQRSSKFLKCHRYLQVWVSSLSYELHPQKEEKLKHVPIFKPVLHDHSDNHDFVHMVASHGGDWKPEHEDLINLEHKKAHE